MKLAKKKTYQLPKVDAVPKVTAPPRVYTSPQGKTITFNDQQYEALIAEKKDDKLKGMTLKQLEAQLR